MEWSIPVRRGDTEVAQLQCAGDGLRTWFVLRCSPGAEVEKLWLQGQERLLLGTPSPSGEGMILRRTVSNRQLLPLRPITHGVLLPASAEGAPPLPRSVVDPELRQLLEGSGFSLTEQGEGALLSWRWQPGQPLPVPALATLMYWQQGRLWLTIQNGWPVLIPPPNP